MKKPSLFLLLFVATFTALAVRLFLIEDYRISSDSMSPTLFTGDLVIVSKLSFNLHLPFSNFELVRLRRPQAGEVVAFALPEEGMATFVKRVVAVEGDTVEVRDGKLLVKGAPLRYVTGPGGKLLEIQPSGVQYPVDWDPAQAKSFGPVDVPKDHFFALGDNRNASIDSRRWGPIPLSCLKGNVRLVWASLNSESGVRWDRTLSSVH